MKRHVNEHVKGLHTICEPCSFFQELMGKPPVLSAQKHDERVKYKREKEIFNAWKGLQIEGSIVNGFTCTKCATTQSDQNHEHRTFKYDDMRKHVLEHGRGDHSHCKECSFFEALQGKPPIRRTREHLSSANHKTEKEMYDMWMDLEVQGTMSAGFRCTKCAESRGKVNPSSYTFIYTKITPFLPKNRQFLTLILPFSSASLANFLVLGSSLNAVVVFNLEVTHAAHFALKTTTAFNKEPKTGNILRLPPLIETPTQTGGSIGILHKYRNIA